MNAPHWNGDPDHGKRLYRREREPERPVESCTYARCERTVGVGAVSVAGVGMFCSHDCRNAYEGHRIRLRREAQRRESA